MKLQSGSRIIYGSVSIAFVFIFLFGMVNSTYAISKVRTDHTLSVQDTIGPETYVTSDSLDIGQPTIFPGEDPARITEISKEEMKARRKAKADRFWNNLLLGFFRILITDGCCNCEDY